VEAYFAAVVRRSVMDAHDARGRSARRRLVFATIEADLLEAGWSAQRAAAEAARVAGEGSREVGVA
jgi:hypothetical protein